MEISVIIPTYNGAHKLPGIIASLQNQTVQDFEVVVVIDGSTDQSVAVLKNLNPGFSSFKIIEQENKGRAAVRNKGAEMASGDLLIFFDDDMLPIEDCIQKHVLHHQCYPNTIVTGSQIEDTGLGASEFQRFKAYLSWRWTQPFIELGKQPLEKKSLFLSAANFSIRSSLFRKLGGFDSRLNDAEDFDLAVRAYKAGVDLYFDLSAFAWHNDKLTCVSYIKRQKQYRKAHETLIELKPWLKDEGFIKPVVPPTGLKAKAFQFFKYSFWVSAIDQNRLKLFPKKIRYKLYDIITTVQAFQLQSQSSIKAKS